MSLQRSVTLLFSNTLQFGVSYTLSKSMDNGSNQRDVVPDTYDTSMLWGPSEFDSPHTLILNYLYQFRPSRNQPGFTANARGCRQATAITPLLTPVLYTLSPAIH